MADIESHPFMPGDPSKSNDVDICSMSGCGKLWNAYIHQPSEYLSALMQEATGAVRTASQNAGVPEGLVSIPRPSETPPEPATDPHRLDVLSVERASAPPFEMPADGYLPRGFAMLHGIDPVNVVPAKPLTDPAYECPHTECPYATRLPNLMADHLRTGHRWNSEGITAHLAQVAVRLADAQEARRVSEAVTPLKHNGVTTQLYSCPKVSIVHDKHLWQPDEGTEWFTCLGDVSPSLDCPHCGNAYLRSRFLRHLREEEAVDQSELDEQAELNGLPPLPPITPEEAEETVNIIEDLMEEAGRKNRERRHRLSLKDQLQEQAQKVTAFMNPEVSTEEVMAAAGFTEGELMDAMDDLAPHYFEDLLSEWWIGKAEDEVRRTVPKAVEYGATDLSDIGHDLAKCMGREVTDAEAAELGVFFYVRGKMSRWVDAVKRGDQVSDDTLFDIGVYIRMAQRIRDAGGWPGLPMPDKK